MIEINLLPQNLRSNKQTAMSRDRVIYFSKIGLIVLVAIHILLVIAALCCGYRNSRLTNVWSDLSLQNTSIISLKEEVNTFNNKIKLVDELIQNKSHWSEKLNKLSLLLPGGIWFNRFRLTEDNLDISGSVVSLEANEVEILNNFLQALRADKSFYSGFKNIDIISIARSNLFGIEVSNFSIKGILEK